MASASATPSPLAVENTFLSVRIDGQPIRLRALVVKEAARNGRLPVALITHGQSVDVQRREAVDPNSYIYVAREFARRGWLSVVVVRRGFGGSEGGRPYVLPGCSRGDYAAALKGQVDDVAAAIPAIAARSDADAQRIVGFGTSVGGAVMLGLAARQPAGLVAVVNMSGGIASRRRDGSNGPTQCRPEDLMPVFAAFGRGARVPSLWLYAENDSLFSADYVRQLHAAYAAAGGITTFFMFPALKGDGHDLYGLQDGMQRWIPALDGFLRARDLPTYDPRPLDAAVGKILNPQAAAYYSNLYRTRPAEKAMALSPSGKQGYIAYGRATPEQAAKDSLAGCEKQPGGQTCQLVLQNFEFAPVP
jgi:dienelactone hydrolase